MALQYAVKMGRTRVHDEATAAALLEAAEKIAETEGLQALTVRRSPGRPAPPPGPSTPAWDRNRRCSAGWACAPSTCSAPWSTGCRWVTTRPPTWWPPEASGSGGSRAPVAKQDPALDEGLGHRAEAPAVDRLSVRVVGLQPPAVWCALRGALDDEQVLLPRLPGQDDLAGADAARPADQQPVAGEQGGLHGAFGDLDPGQRRPARSMATHPSGVRHGRAPFRCGPFGVGAARCRVPSV